MDFQIICDWIVLVSAVIIASKNIYAFFRRPINDIHQWNHKNEENHINAVVDTRREEVIEEIKNTIITTLSERVNEVKNISLEQQAQIAAMNEEMHLIGNAQKDIMRVQLSKIYYQYLPYHKIKSVDKKVFNNLYSDYHALKGNSWVEDIKNEIDTWDVVEDKYQFSEKDLF